MFKVVAVVAPQNRGWILDRIAKEIINRSPKPSAICYNPLNIPPSENYFITHYTLTPVYNLENTTVFFTHPSASIDRYKERLAQCRAIITANQAGIDHLVSNGINQEKIHMIPEGTDPSIFIPHERSNGPILISGHAYARKNLPLIKSIIDFSKVLRYVIVGRSWPEDITNQKNVTYHREIHYDKYPSIYASCDTYLSCSTLEGGGPNALIEAMHCNMVPVVSNTGNANEYITNAHNGFILPLSATARDYIDRINRAHSIKTDISKTVATFTWESFCLETLEYLLPKEIHATT